MFTDRLITHFTVVVQENLCMMTKVTWFRKNWKKPNEKVVNAYSHLIARFRIFSSYLWWRYVWTEKRTKLFSPICVLNIITFFFKSLLGFQLKCARRPAQEYCIHTLYYWYLKVDLCFLRHNLGGCSKSILALGSGCP